MLFPAQKGCLFLLTEHSLLGELPFFFFSPETGCERLLWKLTMTINIQGQDEFLFAGAHLLFY